MWQIHAMRAHEIIEERLREVAADRLAREAVRGREPAAVTRPARRMVTRRAATAQR